MEVPEESFHWSSWDSRTCYPRRAFIQGLTDDFFSLALLFLSFAMLFFLESSFSFTERLQEMKMRIQLMNQFPKGMRFQDSSRDNRISNIISLWNFLSFAMLFQDSLNNYLYQISSHLSKPSLS